MEVDCKLPFANYTFNKEYHVNYGEALFLTGSLPELGAWDTSKAIRMTCHHQNYWMVVVTIPIELEIQYKFFVGPYEC